MVGYIQRGSRRGGVKHGTGGPTDSARLGSEEPSHDCEWNLTKQEL
ncbi:unnamed protein product [Camellia sinensis]